jgi:hypothetical protein
MDKTNRLNAPMHLLCQVGNELRRLEGIRLALSETFRQSFGERDGSRNQYRGFCSCLAARTTGGLFAKIVRNFQPIWEKAM